MMTLLFTGGTGFLGKNIMPILQERFNVTTCGITLDNDIVTNLAQEPPILNKHYDVILHACGKAHSNPKSEIEEQAFYDVNYQGTVNLCKGLEKIGVPKALVFISTVAVYGLESGNNITENYPLMGSTPYAKSKILAETYLTEWCANHNVILSIIRPSLLAGKDAPGNLGAMVSGIKKGYYVNIAGGKAVKSVLMTTDIARILPYVIDKGGIYNVCDTRQPAFGELAMSVAKQLGKRPPLSIPYWVAWCMAKVGDILGGKFPINSIKLKKMTSSLTFSNDKARKELGWEPLDVIDNFSI